MISRRGLLLGSTALLVIGAWQWRRRMNADERRIKAVLTRAFGPEVVRSEAAQEFIAALQSQEAEDIARQDALFYIWRGEEEMEPDAQIERYIALGFLLSTNVVRAHETGEELYFNGLYAPNIAPCANPLSASWL